MHLPRSIVNQILTHAQSSPAAEVCGLIGAVQGRPQHCYAVANVSGEPARLFAMDPKGQIDAMRRMREAGQELFAIYHSHPRTPALPSPRDVGDDEYPDALKLIVSLSTKGVLEMRGYFIRDDEVQEVALDLET